QHYVVTTTADAGPGSLRSALAAAALAGGSDVTFAVRGSIALQSALPNLFRSTRVLGPAAALTVQRSPAAGTPAFRVCTVDRPAGAIRDVSVSLSGLTIANGQAAALAAGGGIFNTATLALTSCTLSGNSAFLGGGIENEGALTLADCTLAANTASLDG